MKTAEIIKLIAAGKSLLTANFVSDEIRSGTSQKSGKPYVLHTVNCLVGDGTLEVSMERSEAGASPTKLGLARFAPVVVELAGAPEVYQGRLNVRATAVYPVEA